MDRGSGVETAGDGGARTTREGGWLPGGRPGRLLTLGALGVAAAWTALWAVHHGDLPVSTLEHRYAEGEDDFRDVAGMRVHYRDEGPREADRTAGGPTAPPLCCLHGTFASLHTWDGWAAELTDEHRVVRPDLPGHGLTGPHSDDDYSMVAYVEFVAAFCDALGIEECVVAGNSRGGEVAWRFALDHPDRVAGLVLVDSMGFPLAVPGRSTVMVVPVLPRVLSRLTPRRLVRRNLEDVYGAGDVPPELVDRYSSHQRYLFTSAVSRRSIRDRTLSKPSTGRTVLMTTIPRPRPPGGEPRRAGRAHAPRRRPDTPPRGAPQPGRAGARALGRRGSLDSPVARRAVRRDHPGRAPGHLRRPRLRADGGGARPDRHRRAVVPDRRDSDMILPEADS